VHGGSGKAERAGESGREGTIPCRGKRVSSGFPIPTRRRSSPLPPFSGKRKSRRSSSGGLRVARACLYRAAARARKASRLTRRHARTRWHPMLPVSLCFPGASTGFPKGRINSPGPGVAAEEERREEGGRGLYTRRWSAFPHVHHVEDRFSEPCFSSVLYTLFTRLHLYAVTIGTRKYPIITSSSGVSQHAATFVTVIRVRPYTRA